MIVPDLGSPHIESFWPTSFVGWITSVSITATLGKMLFDRVTGRAVTLKGIGRDLSDLDERMKEYETTSGIMAQQLNGIERMLTDIDHELRGVRGDNGMKKTLQRLCADVEAIERRNADADIFNALVKQFLAKYDGPERRESVRQLRNLLGDKE